MKGKAPAQGHLAATAGGSSWPRHMLLAATALLVIVLLGFSATSGGLEHTGSGAEKSYYNLLVQAFRAGQLNLPCEVPPGLAQLPDPYDPAASLPYRWIEGQPLHDLSYYHGKLYLYWGVTPAFLLFWPYAAVTGHYLLHKDAVVVFCVAGFLASVGLLLVIWRRYFPDVSVLVVVAGALALGLATGLPVFLSRCDVYEVAISCGYALMMLALAALWRALHQPSRSVCWLAAASLAYGLAVGARPNLLFGAVILLLPAFQARTEGRPVWPLLLAALGPLAAIGLGLMCYNARRFGDPLEFGQRYQLAFERQDTMQHFSLGYLWFNFRVYFLEPVRWSSSFPFVGESRVPLLPAGHVSVQRLFGILTGLPVVWLAMAAPLAWRDEGLKHRAALRWFVIALVLLFAMVASVVCLFNYTCVRYMVDFLPALMLLAVVGILGLERARAGQPAWRRGVRWGWVGMLVYSLGFSLLAGFEHHALARYDFGNALVNAGHPDVAVGLYREALKLDAEPVFAAEVQDHLGDAFAALGRADEAMRCYRLAVQLQPDYADPHNNLGIALVQNGELDQAAVQFHAAIRSRPDDATAHNSLANILLLRGQYPEAVSEYETALRLNPGYAEAHNNLGYTLAKLGRLDEALAEYQEALRLNGAYPQAHYNLACALTGLGRREEAIAHLDTALRLRPDYAEAKQKLGELNSSAAK